FAPGTGRPSGVNTVPLTNEKFFWADREIAMDTHKTQNRLFFMVLCQQPLNHLLRVFVSFGSGVAKLNYTVLIHNKVAWPRVAEIVAPDLIFIINDHWILNTLVCDRFLYFRYVFLVVDTRNMHANDDKTVFSIFVVQFFDVGHGLSAKWTIPSPKINE